MQLSQFIPQLPSMNIRSLSEVLDHLNNLQQQVKTLSCEDFHNKILDLSVVYHSMKHRGQLNAKQRLLCGHIENLARTHVIKHAWQDGQDAMQTRFSVAM
ncbi:hypothetical protein DEB41_17670 (plasmid) [Vibrio anguillarum]|uniref:Uncharacterized protein n=6 Tax=Vibrio anguillarum TaxID=55601 RepID=A0A7U5W5H8_VIBAN|nr:hypothetical protein [Vibrio anguillarum]AAR12554.1 hypothetical protein [Vibrio anguillarum 775]AGU59989.1 hypothetical protein N175_19525 [Vibrio anguillarum M3]ATA51740.1 hypothetical protein CLI14_18935 [Vibrio anguillarum]AVT65634.1 hypothetical protein B5S57_00035 [Vibrio anguillarum]AXN09329.1 hypothetical protein DEA53_17875 [Vibrio anguillarum]